MTACATCPGVCFAWFVILGFAPSSSYIKRMIIKLKYSCISLEKGEWQILMLKLELTRYFTLDRFLTWQAKCSGVLPSLLWVFIFASKLSSASIILLTDKTFDSSWIAMRCNGVFPLLSTALANACCFNRIIRSVSL